MCGRYVSPDTAAIERFYRIDRHSPHPFVPRFNVAPTTLVPVIHLEEGRNVLREARWGLVPGWWKQPRLPTATFNARSEEAARKPMWRQSYARGRCLLPARGWYEWHRREVVDRDTGEVRNTKQPFLLHHREPVIAFAGLLAFRQQADGSTLACSAVLTRAAAGIAAQVHERMPVVLAREDCAAWLDPALPHAAVGELITRAVDDFVVHPVSTQVNSTRNDSPALLEAVGAALQDPATPSPAGGE